MFLESKKRVFTPANLVSFIRVGIAIGFFYVLYRKEQVAGIILLAVFVLLDILDGYIARRFNCTSDLGVMLDHGTDKFFAVGTLIILFVHGIVPPPVFYAFVIRDIAMSVGWVFVRVKKNLLLSSRFYGKLSGGFYFLLLLVYLLNIKEFLLYGIMFITLILYYVSALYYARGIVIYRRKRNNEW